MVNQEKKDKTTLNLANALSILRMVLAPFFMIEVFNGNYRIAFVIIFIAILTDFLDGHIARIWKMQTRLGKMLDPAADKIIIFFAIITLMIKFGFPPLLGIIIIARDLMFVPGSILFLYRNKNKVLVPNLLGKISTFFQMASILFYILYIATERINIVFINILLGITLFITLFSLVVYFIKGHRLFYGKRKSRINLPNKITLIRIALIPIFIAFLLSSIRFKEIVAAIIFILLALSDALDGYLARKRGQITSFGKLIDPLADKLLVTSALIFLIGKGIEPWMAYTIIAREFAVTGVRMIAATKNQILPARKSGKVKTVVQVVAITAVLLNISFSNQFMIIAVIVTVYSGIEYIWIGRHLFKELA
ncbi:MAG: CDP-diacylglycerol--glycerol-3-phosphate 3-phosphatidyltransferase [Nanoarchaeota archaeon]|nr:CDP-diacylglycerol--glycerol-3-phosphate 3-phosphatidyltransferase [Nanoarchaeota archaeon]